MLPDLAGLVGVLADYRVRYVVIGGVAVAAHGYVRATEDVDLVTPTGTTSIASETRWSRSTPASRPIRPAGSVPPSGRRCVAVAT